MRAGALFLACVAPLLGAAAGCRSKDPKPADPPPAAAASSANESTAPAVAPAADAAAAAITTISITGESFADLRFGTPLTEETIRRTFPGATFRKVDGVARGGGPSWIVKREEDGLVAAADAEKIVVEGGAVELYGVRAGDDVSALAGPPFEKAKKVTCSVAEENDDPFCAVETVSLRVGHCPSPPRRGTIPVARLAGCKVREIWWFAVEPPED